MGLLYFSYTKKKVNCGLISSLNSLFLLIAHKINLGIFKNLMILSERQQQSECKRFANKFIDIYIIKEYLN